MISCHRLHFEARCVERGVSLEGAMACVVAKNGDEWTIDVNHPAYPSDKMARPPDALAGPGFLDKVKNFAAAAAQHVAAGMPMCTDEEIIARHDICLKCEHLVNSACNLCGCPVARVAGYVSKLSWADQECPVGKWGKVRRDADIDDSKTTA